jgi:hypothetical protein
MKKTDAPKKNNKKCKQVVVDLGRTEVPKTSRISKLYFWLFVTLAIMSAFMFWASRGESFVGEKGDVNITLISGICALLLSLMFGLFCFIRFIRNRSIAGGLFLTTAMSTAIFFGSSQIVGLVIAPTAAAFGSGVEGANAGLATVTGLAQIGLFALWFMFLLLTIYTQVSPVKKIDKALQHIIDGDEIKRVKIGRARQYRGIAEKIALLSAERTEQKLKEKIKREKAKARREKKEEQNALKI